MESHEMVGIDRKPVVVAGGGPAGMMAGLLLARAGVRVTVLEKHGDFLRDFRGDTVHPSTLEIFHELDLLDELLELPHSRIDGIGIRVAGRELQFSSLAWLDVAAPFIAMMPQWDLLDFIASKACRYPGFELKMSSEAVGVTIDSGGRIDGVRLADGSALEAELVIAADGRRSVLRKEADLPLETIGAPMDVFWFRLDKPPSGGPAETFGVLEAGRFLILIDRMEYFQCAYPFAKGQAQSLRDQGLSSFRDSIAALVPELARPIEKIDRWDKVRLLEVSLDRLTRWHRPGLLAIGDAAHAMSPIGGVGINVAVQDAVAVANVLAEPLARGAHPDTLLHQVQERRWRAVTRMQALQKLAQDRVIEPILRRRRPLEKPPLALRMLDRFPLLRRIPSRIIGMGFDPEHVESPDAFAESTV